VGKEGITWMGDILVTGDITLGGQVNTWKLDLNPSNGKYLVYKRQASHPIHLTIHTGKLYMYVTEGVNPMCMTPKPKKKNKYKGPKLFG
jgi:hypothetical protein